jgi:kynurenine formamidase
LTHSIDPQAGDRVKTASRVNKEYFLRNTSSAEPFETRIDAPAHFARGLWTVDQIPTERLIAPLVVLDVSANVENHPDYQISVEDIAAWEQAHNQIPLGSVVIARTGWDSRWKSANGYHNAATHFPGYSPDAAKFLVEGRNVLGLGIDTPNIDNGPSKNWAVRQYTLSHSVYQLENVANLDRVPAVSAMVVVAPTKLESGSSGPVRILALVQ